MEKIKDIEELIKKEKRKMFFCALINFGLLAGYSFVILSKGIDFLAITLYAITFFFVFLIFKSKMKIIELKEQITKKFEIELRQIVTKKIEVEAYSVEEALKKVSTDIGKSGAIVSERIDEAVVTVQTEDGLRDFIIK